MTIVTFVIELWNELDVREREREKSEGIQQTWDLPITSLMLLLLSHLDPRQRKSAFITAITELSADFFSQLNTLLGGCIISYCMRAALSK